MRIECPQVVLPVLSVSATSLQPTSELPWRPDFSPRVAAFNENEDGMPNYSQIGRRAGMLCGSLNQAGLAAIRRTPRGLSNNRSAAMDGWRNHGLQTPGQSERWSLHAMIMSCVKC